MAHAAALPQWLGIAAIGVVGVVGAMLAGVARRFVLLGRLPRPSKEHWLLGSLRQMLHPRNHLVMSKWAKDLGGIYTFRILFTRAVVVTDGAIANVVLGTRLGLNKALEPALSDELLSNSGHHTMFSAGTRSQHWQLLRKGTAEAFSPRAVRESFSATSRILGNIVGSLQQGGWDCEWDINNVLMRFAMDMTSYVMVGKETGVTRNLGDPETDSLFSIMKYSLEELTLRCIDPLRRYLIWRPDVRHGARQFRRFRSAMQDLVREAKERGPVEDTDCSVAAQLLRIRDPKTGRPLPDELLAGEFGMFFTAGLETSGNQITWIMYLISQYADVETRLAAELDAAGLLASSERPQPRTLQHADLSTLPYLSCVCKEAMRFAPVAATGTTRRARSDVMLGGHLIPKGSVIIVPFHGVHHSTANFGSTADRFHPARWMTPTASAHVTLQGAASDISRLDDSQKAAGIREAPAVHDGGFSAAQQAYMPFSTGPRRCFGQPLALQMQLAAVATICSHFRFELAERMGGPEGVAKSSINRLTLQPGEGMWMRFFPRAMDAKTSAT